MASLMLVMPPANAEQKWLHKVDVTFERNRDPLQLSFHLNGSLIEAEHLSSDFRHISGWGKGQSLQYAYSSITGSVLLDAKGLQVPVFPKQAQQHLIELKLSKCLAEAPTSLAAGHCIGRHQQSWDNELNRIYHTLTVSLDGNVMEELRVSQRSWIRFRDAQIKATSNIYGQKQGSIWPLEAGIEISSITRDQAMRLARLLKLSQ